MKLAAWLAKRTGKTTAASGASLPSSVLFLNNPKPDFINIAGLIIFSYVAG